MGTLLLLLLLFLQPVFIGRVAQWIARWTSDPTVEGSSPFVVSHHRHPTNFAHEPACAHCTTSRVPHHTLGGPVQPFFQICPSLLPYHHSGTLASVLPSNRPKDRGRQDSNLRVKITIDFESTPVTTWVRPLMLTTVFLSNRHKKHPQPPRQ